jgi:ABC-2 type transport system permease protein
VIAAPRWWRHYHALLRAEVQAAAAYRAQLVLGVVSWVAPLAFLALWRGAAGAGTVGGISPSQLSAYFCLLLATTTMQITMPVIFELGGLVYRGELSGLLLRPSHPLQLVTARALAEKAFRGPLLLVVVPMALVLTRGTVSADPGTWLLAVLVTLLGAADLAYLAALAGTLAFWMTKAQGVQSLLVAAEWVVGGIVAPVALLPGPLPELVRHQPLWFAVGAGPELLSGISHYGIGVLIEATVWLVVLHRLFALVWRRALTRYDSVGG